MVEEVAVTATTLAAAESAPDLSPAPSPASPSPSPSSASPSPSSSPLSASALPPPENSGAVLFAARPSLIREMNEQLLLEHLRQRGACSRAELSPVSALSNPPVSLSLHNVERAG